MKIITTILLLLLICLCGCVTNIETYGKLDLTDKRITVPSGGVRLIGEIKSALKKEGWELLVYRGPKVTEGSLGENLRLEEYDTYNTRYTIFIDCYHSSWVYDLSMVDNKTGAEVITMSGQDDPATVVKKFLKALKENS